MITDHSTSRRNLTFELERRRAVCAGVIETGAHTFLLLIAVQYFQAGANAKALVASAGSFGLLIAPLVVTLVEKLGLTTAKAAASLAAFSSFSFLLMSVIPTLPVFVLGSVFAIAAGSASVPLVTQIYQENYPQGERGKIFSRTMMIRIGSAVIFADLAGRALSGRIQYFQILILFFACAAAVSTVCFMRCPSKPLLHHDKIDIFRGMRFAKTDRLFRQTLICWMLMGFANLMMMPMRVEYLANPKYGLGMEPAEVAMLVSVIPNLARLVLSPVWGHLFDKVNFFILRVAVNLGFATGILTFFFADDFYGLLLGALAFGIANAGGDIAWSLWVTKFAPPAHVADYMSVHTFFTGLRGIVAPFAAFHLAATVSLTTMGCICAGLIFLASILLLPELRTSAATDPAVT
jgi:MFS family permease